ncbi:MAG: cytochrome c oxidase assembly protein [Planctomyces sp.]|nr:cytochrome c oxidase assembly protein [Planctomyces sp.]
MATAFGVLPASFAHADVAELSRRAEWTDWHADPVLLLTLTLAAWTYVRGLARYWLLGGREIGPWHAAAFAGGLASIALALLSPVDAASDQLAAAHMVQHMLLAAVAAPLVVLGAPGLVCLWGLPDASRRDLARIWTRLRLRRLPWSHWRSPRTGWLLFALTLWAWHLPALYSAAVRTPAVHDLQHLSFFGAGCLYWRSLLDPVSRFRLSGSAAALSLFGTTLHSTILGAFMTLAPVPWYGDFEGRTGWWGLTPLEDQQLAGLIMWMPACVPYLLAAAVLLGRSLSRESPAVSMPMRPALRGGSG